MRIRRIRSPHAKFEPHLERVTLVRHQVRQCHTDLDIAISAWLHKSPSPPPWSPAVRLYLHALCVEDITIQSVLHEGAPQFKFWPNLDGPADVAALRQYARAVYASTEAYLIELPPGGLSRVVDLNELGLGRRTVVWVFRRFVLQELGRIRGEIAAGTGSTGTAWIPNPPVLDHAGSHDRFKGQPGTEPRRQVRSGAVVG